MGPHGPSPTEVRSLQGRPLTATINRLGQALAALCDEELTHVELADQTIGLIKHHLGLGLTCWWTVDPSTDLQTFVRLPHPVANRLMAFLNRWPGRDPFQMNLELDEDDPLSMRWMVRQPEAALSLMTTLDRKGVSSRRLEFFATVGVVDEARVRLVDRGHTWGLLSIARRDRLFDAQEVRMLGSFGGMLGAAQRRCFLRSALACGGDMEDRPGLVMFDKQGRIQHMSAEARKLIANPDGAGGMVVWSSILGQLNRPDSPDRLTLMGPTGPLTAHTSTLDGYRALLLERTRPLVLKPLLLLAYGLTERERQVVQAVCKGMSTRQIAFELDLADYTVQDHLKSVFRKMAVRTRKELVAALMNQQYMPQLRKRATPAPDGWFLPVG